MEVVIAGIFRPLARHRRPIPVRSRLILMFPGPPAVYRPERREKGQQRALWIGVEARREKLK